MILLETIRTIFKDELAARKAAFKEVINSNMKSTNERLDKLSTEMAQDPRSILMENTQDQLDDKLKTIETDIKNSGSRVKELSKKLESALI